ncbi:MAG: hypothetical protein F6K49_48225 [Moorea sp. SIO3I6]|nr:hypothetical protein [Moorena sp. SIO3I6]
MRIRMCFSRKSARKQSAVGLWPRCLDAVAHGGNPRMKALHRYLRCRQLILFKGALLPLIL